MWICVILMYIRVIFNMQYLYSIVIRFQQVVPKQFSMVTPNSWSHLSLAKTVQRAEDDSFSSLAWGPR